MRSFEREELIVEIIKHLVNEGYICPALLSVEDLKDRVSTKERQYIPGLTDDMHNDNEIPFRKSGTVICVTDAGDARDFVFDKGGLI